MLTADERVEVLLELGELGYDIEDARKMALRRASAARREEARRLRARGCHGDHRSA